MPFQPKIDVGIGRTGSEATATCVATTLYRVEVETVQLHLSKQMDKHLCLDQYAGIARDAVLLNSRYVRTLKVTLGYQCP
jgi:hypothetical protein